MSKHTPGPWIVDESRYEGSINALEPFRHIGMVSQFQYDRTSRAENEANAHLIAAAPDLLEALESVLEQFEMILPQSGVVHDERMAIIKAQAAIAKARNEP